MTGQEVRTLKGHTSPVTSVCFAPRAGDWPAAAGMGS